ncbi:MAG: sugar porter family MFS transporter [Mesorhizobium sp.]|nr:MAG: sugar porter family MFS transporter [Mesorhizobium sp.]
MVIVVCIISTIGFEGLINSGPGPARQGMAGAVLIASLIFVALRGNIAARRTRDANGRRWIMWAYIALSAVYALLQAGVLLVVKFDDPESIPGGLNLLGLSIFGLWCTILWAKPVAGSNIDELTDVFDFDGPLQLPAFRPHRSPSAGRARPASASAAYERACETAAQKLLAFASSRPRSFAIEAPAVQSRTFRLSLF